MRRKEQFETGNVYHVCNKSIAGFEIFNDEEDFTRMEYLFRYYQFKRELSYSHFINNKYVETAGFDKACQSTSSLEEKNVCILSFCIMPTHYHLVVKQLMDDGISQFIGNIQNSYAKYFNAKHNRHGPLWVGRFRGIKIESEEQLVHLTRYVHLNPMTAGLVKKPEEWKASSYKEFLYGQKICEFENIMDIAASDYKKFIDDQASYQKSLAKIKEIIKYA